MSELQIGLIGLGAAAIVGVMAYNTWQEYRQRKLVEKVLHAAHADILLDAGEGSEVSASAGHADEAFASPIAAAAETPEAASGEFAGAPEPVESAEPAVERHAARLRDERREPVMHAAPEFPDAGRREPSVGGSEPPLSIDPPKAERTEQFEKHDKAEKGDPEPVHLISPVIDYVVALEATDAKPASELLTAQQPELVAVGKALSWIGYNEATREWEGLSGESDREYRRLRVGLQLVDRRGPVAASDLAIFHDAMQSLAEEWMAVADLPPCQSALDAAAALDAFCAGVDIQIGINVIAGGVVFPGTKLRALAESAGMVLDAEGRFVRCDEDGNVLYVLINQEAAGFSAEAMKTLSTHGVTFVLDVPRVAHGERVFAQMVDLAKRFADVLRGALVDDNRRPLSEAALEPIRRQVAQYQAQMLAHKLPAGGPLAQRLFS